MEGWAGREGKENLIKPIINKDIIFTTKYVQDTYGGQASPDPLVELRCYPDSLAAMDDHGKECPLKQHAAAGGRFATGRDDRGMGKI